MEVSVTGRNYTFARGSDLDRDGMFLELVDQNANLMMEAFYSDQTHQMKFTASVTDIALELVEAFIAEARLRLPPSGRAPEISN